MRGRKPKPSSIKAAAGNPGKRPLNPDEPQPDRGAPLPPADLPPEQKKHWDAAVELLDNMGILTVADALPLHLLTRATSEYLWYCDMAPIGSDVLFSEGAKNADGEVTKEGKMYWNMAAAARNQAWGRLLEMLREFGLTPSSRSRIAAKPKAVHEGKARFFKLRG